MSFKKRLVNTVKKGAKCLTLLVALNTVSVNIMSAVNLNLETEKKTAVFTCGRGRYDLNIPSSISSRFIDFFMYTPITLKQNLNGYHVDWYTNSDKKTLITALQDSSYENLVFIGHGSKSSYSLSDADIESLELKQLHIPKRRGEFLQYTCGNKDGDQDSLKDVLFDHNCYFVGFDTIIDPFTNYGSAWKDLVTMGG